MTAVVRDRYGAPDVLERADVPVPALVDDGVLVRVRAVSVNPADWFAVTGTPYLGRALTGLRQPRSRLVGTDFAGTVEAVGKDVTQFRPGDEVLGGRSGAFAEQVCARTVARKPANLTFEEAAAVPLAGLTALQGLRDKGQVRAGHRVLINGASGGVGTFAVQIAKALGAEVTAVCSTGNVELVRSLGADRVIDYAHEDFTRSGGRYDVLLDIAGSRPWSDCERALAPRATVVLVGGPKTNRLLGPGSHSAAMLVRALGSRRKAAFFVARFNRPDLDALREMLEAGTVRPVIDRSYPLTEIADAFRYLSEGHARGKVVLTV
ncbi:MAG: NAD(P)-dependent alcohol dehydrogenase [Frankiaceae bacterium]